uniref:Zn(2)-C6 fungal-type domain-containing protein n=1 Tax=Bionectria ochroleuca TaxID=29856 RepID=A0A8H7TQS3_BIOOC
MSNSVLTTALPVDNPTPSEIYRPRLVIQAQTMFSGLDTQSSDPSESSGGADEGEDGNGHVTAMSFYGRACTNCYAVKCKCEYPAEGGSCLRCRRLDKECRPTVPVRRRRVQKESRSRTARLERQLSELMALVGTTSRTGSGESPDLATSTAAASVCSQTYNSTPISHTPSSTGIPDDPSIQHPINPIPSISDDGQIVHLSDNEWDESLIIFQLSILQGFPFIYIAQGVGPAQFRCQYPIVSLCIVFIASSDLQRKVAMGKTISETLTKKIIIQRRANVDLLLASIYFTGWIHHNGKPEMLTAWVQLTLTVVHDMKLNVTKLDSMLLRRALLGAFILASIGNQDESSVQALKWTSIMNESLTILADTPECPGDRLLAAQVHCHLIHQDLPLAGPFLGQPGTEVEHNPARQLYQQEASSRLQKVKTAFQMEAACNPVIAMTILATEQAIFSTAIISNFHRSLLAVSGWFRTFLPLGAQALTTLPIASFVQLSSTVETLFSLTTFESPLWDTELVTQTVDVFATMDTIAHMLKSIPGILGQRALPNATPPGEMDVISVAVENIKEQKKGWESVAAEKRALRTLLDEVWGYGMTFNDLDFEGLQREGLDSK